MKVEDSPSKLIGLLDPITRLADQYKNEIGFWPAASIKEAILRGRLIAAVAERGSGESVVGFLVYGGVFPNSSIQAVAVANDFLRCGIAQILLNAILSKLESESYIAVRAKPASDLAAAQGFYAKNGFEKVRVEKGGSARKRQIVVREKTLDNPDLFSIHEFPQQPVHSHQTTGVSALWVIDINVLLDLVKEGRKGYSSALEVFGGAFDGRVRIATTSEFAVELERSTKNFTTDPLLRMAKAIPVLKAPSRPQASKLADQIREAVFLADKPSQADSSQAKSDCLHLANCILGNASAFVTSDRVLLRNKALIRNRWGLEVAALDEFDEAIQSCALEGDRVTEHGADYVLRGSNGTLASDFAKSQGASHVVADFEGPTSGRTSSYFEEAADKYGKTIGILCLQPPLRLGSAFSLVVIVDHRNVTAEKIADILLLSAMEKAVETGISYVSLRDLQGQILVRNAALRLGFRRSELTGDFEKVVAGQPVTPAGYRRFCNKARLSVGQRLDELLPATFEELDQAFERNPDEIAKLELLCGPLLVVSNHRAACIQPIQKAYADELLGTSRQLNWLDQFGGSFSPTKTYVSSVNTKNIFQPNQLIFFYESSRSGGRAAIVAAARIDDVVTVKKSDVKERQLETSVVDSVDRFSAGDEVAMFSFSSILRLPKPVTLAVLKSIKAEGGRNLQSATRISTASAQAILELGWDNDS